LESNPLSSLPVLLPGFQASRNTPGGGFYSRGADFTPGGGFSLSLPVYYPDVMTGRTAHQEIYGYRVVNLTLKVLVFYLAPLRALLYITIHKHAKSTPIICRRGTVFDIMPNSDSDEEPKSRASRQLLSTFKDGNSWDTWKFKTQTKLNAKNYWYVIEEDPPLTQEDVVPRYCRPSKERDNGRKMHVA
jgi:hypothetical protein